MIAETESSERGRDLLFVYQGGTATYTHTIPPRGRPRATRLAAQTLFFYDSGLEQFQHGDCPAGPPARRLNWDAPTRRSTGVDIVARRRRERHAPDPRQRQPPSRRATRGRLAELASRTSRSSRDESQYAWPSRKQFVDDDLADGYNADPLGMRSGPRVLSGGLRELYRDPARREQRHEGPTLVTWIELVRPKVDKGGHNPYGPAAADHRRLHASGCARIT